MDHSDRVVVLIDMDCFYCQVEEKLNPELKGKPIAVVQYNPWKGGGIIAVNYVARAMGVTRHMRGDEAKEKCPEIHLPSVPCQRGKADITKIIFFILSQGKEVAKVLQKFTPLLERASIDEAYLDITDPVEKRLITSGNAMVTPAMPNTFALGYDSIDGFMSDVRSCRSDCIDFEYEHARRLLAGAVIVSEIRAAVFDETGYTCSAGIAHNKILAKLVCGMNKPNKQTILPKHSINILYKTLSLKKVKHLGGKFGDVVCKTLRITNMAELQQFSEKELQSKFDEKNGSWLYNIARGIDTEPVQARFNPKSIGCCKQLRGRAALLDLDSLKKWLKDLGDEIEDRLEKDSLENNRTPKQMVVSFSTQLPDGSDTSGSRSYNFAPDDELCGELFSKKALELVIESTEGKIKEEEGNRKLKAPIKFLGMSVGKFEDNSENKKTKKILDYFSAGSSKEVSKSIDKDNKTALETNNDKKEIKGKNSLGKAFIFNKFFQNNTNGTGYDSVKEPLVNVKEPFLESTLDKQESFFANLLNKTNKNIVIEVHDESRDSFRSTYCDKLTLTKEVNNCNSNDTDYSGSTINEEINKSIALFDEDPEDVARVTKIRQLLNSSNNDHYNEGNQAKTDTIEENMNQNASKPDTTQCTECNKSIPTAMLATHADYHLALKLREEEREQFRNEIKVKNVVTNMRGTELKKPKIRTLTFKNDTSIIANFVTKFDNSQPTELCSECNKRVPSDKFPEHLDFHEAQKLSRELNKKAIPSIAPNNVKRKRKTSPVKKIKIPCKSIDSFFR